MKQIIFFTLILLPICLNGQNKVLVHGNVVDQNNNLVDYFNVALLSSADSSNIETGTFIDGYFELNIQKKVNYILQISNSLFASKYINIMADSDASINLGKIIIDWITLPEIVVSYKKTLFRQEKGKLIVDVQGSSLSNAGSLVDALKKSPGLIVDSKNNIIVFGKGSPIIYIDEKELATTEELEALQSSDIDKIEIDRNPSAQYSAAGHAVVRIKTKRVKTDRLALLLYNDATLGRKLSNVTGIQLNNKKGGLKNLISYSYGDQNYKDYSDSYEIRTRLNYTIENNGKMTKEYGYNIHRLFSGNDYAINKRQNIGVQFSGYWNDQYVQSNNLQEILKTNNPVINREIRDNGNSLNNLYDININYKLQLDSSSSLSAIIGYANKKNKSRDLIKESNINPQDLSLNEINNKNRYDVYSAKADYKFTLLSSFETAIGVRYAEVVNDGESKSLDIETNISNYSQQNSINDKIGAAYFQVEKKVANFTLEGGLRFESTNSSIKAEDVRSDTTYNKLFSSLAVSYDPSDKFSISLSYSRRIRRPTFREINPNMVYIDSLSYGAGNSFLLPEYSDNIELSTSLSKGLTLTVGYTKKNNFIVNTALNGKENPDILCYTYSNVNKSHIISAGVTFSKTYKVYSGSMEAYVSKPYAKVPYLESKIILKQPTWYFNVRNEFNVSKNLTLNCNFNYSSSGDDGITHYYSYYNLSAEAMFYLFDRKLQLSLTANDILNRAEGNSWEDRYGNNISGLRSDQDYTYIKFRIRYNFNNFKSLIQKRASNSEELDRL